MDRIRYYADLSVRRALGFAGLALITVMMGLSYDPLTALRVAAVLLGLAAAVLVYKARNAIHRNYRRTELWILLDRDIEVPEHRAQQVIGTVLHDTYRHYAGYAVVAAVAVWLVSVLYALAFPSTG